MEATFLDRTLAHFRRVLKVTRRAGAVPLGESLSPDLTDDDLATIRAHIDACLEGRGGEVTARNRAAELGEIYLTLSPAGRQRFLSVRANDYDVSEHEVAPLIGRWQAADDPQVRRTIQNDLRHRLIPPRMRLLQQFNELALGVKFLVDMRAELLKLTRDQKELKPLSEDLRELLASWFDVGFLDLKVITWHTPAALLEKLIEYEAVHAIQSWTDLKNRLDDDRRCYAFFHPRMPEEPLIFVQVALVKGMSDNIQALLDENAPKPDAREADSAIFYSISNCQAGLAGVSFGNFLIKRVANDLKRDMPNVKTFATLSPIPGFTKWLMGPGEEMIERCAQGEIPPVLSEACDAHDWPSVVKHALKDGGWAEDDAIATALRPIIERLCAHYLLEAKRGARALDPVAHFHLTNGARVERINWLGDRSPHGMRQSAGLMVNYLYELSEVDDNHEAYSSNGVIAAATNVSRLLR